MRIINILSLLLFTITSAILNTPLIYAEEPFTDHGIQVPGVVQRGMVTTINDQGQNLVLAWLQDARGCFGLLEMLIPSGEYTLHNIVPNGDEPFASILTSGNLFITQFGNQLLVFDANKRSMRPPLTTDAMLTMSFTEDAEGTIWAASYPDCRVLKYDPKHHQLLDLGSVNQESWPQYPRSIVVNNGHVYIGIGTTATQIIVFNPNDQTTIHLIPEAERCNGYAQVEYSDTGRIFLKNANQPWGEALSDHTIKRLAELPEYTPAPIIAGSQDLVHNKLPNGITVTRVDLLQNYISFIIPGASEERKTFELTDTRGAVLMNAVAANGKIYGSSNFPMCAYEYDPVTNKSRFYESWTQWNAMTAKDNTIYIAAYADGSLWRWHTDQPFKGIYKRPNGPNPTRYGVGKPHIGRPRDVIVSPDGRYVVYGGNADYGHPGGGLGIWDYQENSFKVYDQSEILPGQSVYGLAWLPDNQILIGGSRSPGTGGPRTVKKAELAIFDIATAQVIWHEPIAGIVENFGDMLTLPDGQVIGWLNGRTLFRFDPETKKITRSRSYDPAESNIGEQHKISLIPDNNQIWVLQRNHIGLLNTETLKLEKITPLSVPAVNGGAVLNNRLYYINADRLYSIRLPE